MSDNAFISSLVTVVIPCYNHGHYLGTAIESVLQQSHREVEILVVDDGSSDNTREVAQGYPGVRYLYQNNQGLSAARNTGIANSRGNYLVFLDADDWLYPHALATNLQYLQQNPAAAFVSGAFDRILVEENKIEEVRKVILDEHYCELLQGNYVGVPAAVLYQNWVVKEFLFDTSVPNSTSDYDLYLRIARKYKVLHHTIPITAYRVHASSMSSNAPMMLAAVEEVLKKQKNNLQTSKEHQAYAYGFEVWRNYYSREIYLKLKSSKIKVSRKQLMLLLKYKPKYLMRYFLLLLFPFLQKVKMKQSN